MGFMDMLFLRFAFTFKRICNRMGFQRWRPDEGEVFWESASMYEMRWAVASHPGFETALSYFKDYATNKLFRTSRWLDEKPENPNEEAILSDPYGGRRPWNLKSMTKGDLVELFTTIKTSNISRCMSVVPGCGTKPYFCVDFDVEELATLCMHWEVHPSTRIEEPN